MSKKTETPHLNTTKGNKKKLSRKEKRDIRRRNKSRRIKKNQGEYHVIFMFYIENSIIFKKNIKFCLINDTI